VSEVSFKGIAADLAVHLEFGRLAAYFEVNTIAFNRLYPEFNVGFVF